MTCRLHQIQLFQMSGCVLEVGVPGRVVKFPFDTDLHLPLALQASYFGHSNLALMCQERS